MNENIEILYLPIRLTSDAATALREEAAKFGLTQEELASAILNGECPFDSMTDDERGTATLSQIKDLYPERWTPAMEEAYFRHGAALEETNASSRVKFENYLAQQITVNLPPVLVEFMRETGRLFPELWDIFVRERVEALVEDMRSYLDDSFNFESPLDRRETYRLVEEAREKYLHTIGARNRVGR